MKNTKVHRWLSTKFLEDILEGSFEERISQLVKHAKEEPDWTRDLLLNISKKLRERTTLPENDPDYQSPNSFDNYFKPIKKLFDMNDIAISWPRIYSTFPELEICLTVVGILGTRYKNATFCKRYNG